MHQIMDLNLFWAAYLAAIGYSLLFLYACNNNAIQIYKCVATEDPVANSVGS